MRNSALIKPQRIFTYFWSQAMIAVLLYLIILFNVYVPLTFNEVEPFHLSARGLASQNCVLRRTIAEILKANKDLEKQVRQLSLQLEKCS